MRPSSRARNIPTPGVPESFKVLVKELQALALDIRVLDKDGNEINLSALCDDELEPPNYVSEEDVGESVETDDLFDSFSEKDPDDDDEGFFTDEPDPDDLEPDFD